MIKWQDSYRIGIPEIDTQHQQLFNILEDLEKNIEQRHLGKGLNALTALIDYTTYHFSAEEDIHIASNYPTRLEHQATHNGFLSQILPHNTPGIIDLDTLRELAESLSQWILKHVLEDDVAFADYYKQHQLKVSH